MKKVLLINFIFIILLSSCNYTVEEIFLLPTKVPTVTPSPYLSPTITSTITPTLPTPTYTTTPTLVGYKSPTPTSNATSTPTMEIFITPDTKTPTIAMKGFVSINVAEKVFYTGEGCGPQSVKFTAQAADAAKTAYVTLFVRFKSKTSSDAVSDWSNIDMQDLGTGTFTHELVSSEIKGLEFFKGPWVEYQFVASTLSLKELGRTDIFKEKLSLLNCESTPTPTQTLTPTATLTLTPTQTPLKP